MSGYKLNDYSSIHYKVGGWCESYMLYKKEKTNLIIGTRKWKI
jgi:hypothetical protein